MNTAPIQTNNEQRSLTIANIIKPIISVCTYFSHLIIHTYRYTVKPTYAKPD